MSDKATEARGMVARLAAMDGVGELWSPACDEAFTRIFGEEDDKLIDIRFEKVGS